MEPLFSVVIPTFNRSDFLRRCVESIVIQKCTDFEIIIVDDGSTDNTAGYVANISDTRVRYHYIKHGERSVARNYGIEMALGKYICFIDDDDYVLESYLSDFYDFLKEMKFPDMLVRTGFLVQRGTSLERSVNFDRDRHGNAVRYMAFNMCGVGSLCIPAIYLKEDRFPEEYYHYQDTHLFLRLAARYPLHQLDSWNYVYYIHRESYETFPDAEFRERSMNNLDAIRNVFEQYGDLLNPFLPEYTGRYLLSDKAMQHSAIALIRGRAMDALFLFRIANRYWSVRNNIYRLVRHLPSLIRKKLGSFLKRRNLLEIQS
jgi:glycosyltransferase involved in cell wall biosynthesis